jgi:hypothetical protein
MPTPSSRFRTAWQAQPLCQFPAADFQGDPERFSVKIGSSEFDSRHLKVALDDPECQLSGDIELGPFSRGPSTGYCRACWLVCLGAGDGVLSRRLSFDHSLQGKLLLNARRWILRRTRLHGKGLGQELPRRVGWFSEQFISEPARLHHRLRRADSLAGKYLQGVHRGFWQEGKLHRFTSI